MAVEGKDPNTGDDGSDDTGHDERPGEHHIPVIPTKQLSYDTLLKVLTRTQEPSERVSILEAKGQSDTRFHLIYDNIESGIKEAITYRKVEDKFLIERSAWWEISKHNGTSTAAVQAPRPLSGIKS